MAKSKSMKPTNAVQPRLKAPVMNPIATTLNGRDITRGYIFPDWPLVPQDDVLLIQGNNNLIAYEQLLRDDQVASTFQQRRLALTSCEWEVQPGGDAPADKTAADFLNEQLDRLNFDAICDQMLFGLLYGFSVGECLWDREGSYITLKDIRVRKSRRFNFDGDLRLRLLTYAHPLGEIMPPDKFWVFRNGADNSDEPYGLGLGHQLWWPVFFKKNNLKFWLIYLEKYGMPTAAGKYPPGALPDAKNTLLAALEAIQTDSGIIFPNDMAVDLIEGKRAGTADYDSLYTLMNEAICKIVLGQTMTSEHGSSRSQAEIHMEVRQDLIKADGDALCQSFNTSVATWLTAWNFPTAKTPQLWRRVDEPMDLLAVSKTDTALAMLGYRPSPEYVRATYGGDYIDLGFAAPPPPTLPAASAGGTVGRGMEMFDEGVLPTQLFGQVQKTTAPATDTWIAKLRAMVEQAPSLAALRDQLMAAYPDMKLDQYAARMQQALLVAELAGRTDILDEARG